MEQGSSINRLPSAMDASGQSIIWKCRNREFHDKEIPWADSYELLQILNEKEKNSCYVYTPADYKSAGGKGTSALSATHGGGR